jgi:hypothetical protein
MGRSIRYFAFDFERLGRTLTVALTVPLVAAGTAIVKWGADFEQSLRKVEVLVNQNRSTVARWGNEILQTMVGLGQSPNELAEGLFFAAFLWSVIYRALRLEFSFVPFHVMLAIGFGIVFFYSTFEFKSQKSLLRAN